MWAEVGVQQSSKWRTGPIKNEKKNHFWATRESIKPLQDSQKRDATSDQVQEEDTLMKGEPPKKKTA